MAPPDDETFKKAKGYALRLLKLRPRSRAELDRKMADKGYARPVIDDVLDGLTGLGFIDDAAFARAWLQYRLNRPVGFRRAERELIAKGIPPEMVRAHWDELKENYDELEVVRGLARKRARQYNNIDPLKRRRRLMDYLARRGFRMDIIMKVIRDI